MVGNATLDYWVISHFHNLDLLVLSS